MHGTVKPPSSVILEPRRKQSPALAIQFVILNPRLFAGEGSQPKRLLKIICLLVADL
jgi:hypothetical protein